MKVKITCDYCGESIILDESEARPKTCATCNSFIDHIKATSLDELKPVEETKPSAGFEGLELICQKTGAVIKINHSTQTVIGRESTGKEILSSVQQVSRKHASIDYENDHYCISDLGSTNGTFIGISKIDCKRNPKQILNDGELVYLGKEPFMVRLLKKAGPIVQPEPVQKKPTKFKCASCGTEFKERTDICAQCGSYGSLNPAY
jgi:pSer/pThr/pTyr-binding forkhead associated (FHA) protein